MPTSASKPDSERERYGSGAKGLRRNRPRVNRISGVAKRLQKRFMTVNRFINKSSKAREYKTFRRKERKRARIPKIIAYDFETTPIRSGTPEPLYITAYGSEGKFLIEKKLNNLYDVLDLLNKEFLTDSNNHSKFVAWNGNNFDVYFIAKALLHSKDYTLRPYLTRGNQLRGLRVSPNDALLSKTHSWEFLDGIAMLGMQGKPLRLFLKTFAPDYLKLEADAPNFEKGDSFDTENAAHRRYALRDSEGLYYGMMAAQKIIADNFKIGLTGTIGNMAIKIFQSHIPETAFIKEPRYELAELIRKYVLRGGFCHSVKKYRGPVWKYDLNQAYAAAMRDARLPCGDVFHLPDAPSKYARAYIVRCSASKPGNVIPFYYRAIDGDQTLFGFDSIQDTWITSIEFEQLTREGWSITVSESWNWCESFDMRDYVSKLEKLRVNAEGGPKSAQGEVMKAIGNNSYGKTISQNVAIELVLSSEKPDKFGEYYNDDKKLSHVWYRFCEPNVKEYQQPQIGAFITAHVRMVVRRAALQNPSSWLYADTDCVVFTEYVPLDCDAKKYGKWKVESEGEEQIYITKKVYAKMDGTEKHAKGLNVKPLAVDDFLAWFDGRAPVQNQTHKNNFVKVINGGDMFVNRTKTGQKMLQKEKI